MLKLSQIEICPDEDAPGGAIVAVPDPTGEDGDAWALSPREVALAAAYLLRISEEAGE